MENVMELNLMDEKSDLKYRRRILSEPTRAPYGVRSKLLYLHSASKLPDNYLNPAAAAWLHRPGLGRDV